MAPSMHKTNLDQKHVTLSETKTKNKCVWHIDVSEQHPLIDTDIFFSPFLSLFPQVSKLKLENRNSMRKLCRA